MGLVLAVPKERAVMPWLMERWEARDAAFVGQKDAADGDSPARSPDSVLAVGPSRSNSDEVKAPEE